MSVTWIDFFVRAVHGIGGFGLSRVLGDVYKGQMCTRPKVPLRRVSGLCAVGAHGAGRVRWRSAGTCAEQGLALGGDMQAGVSMCGGLVGLAKPLSWSLIHF